jgi:hypothetical protein
LLGALEATDMARTWLAAQALCQLNILELDCHNCYTRAENPQKMIFEHAPLVQFLQSLLS